MCAIRQCAFTADKSFRDRMRDYSTAAEANRPVVLLKSEQQSESVLDFTEQFYRDDWKFRRSDPCTGVRLFYVGPRYPKDSQKAYFSVILAPCVGPLFGAVGFAAWDL